VSFDAAQIALWLKSNFLLLAELCLAAGLLILSALASPPRALQPLWRHWRGLAARPAASLLFPAALALGLRLLLLPWAEVPYPSSARDEYSYLLAADTFAAGRLTNPPHPQFRHFESPHILFQPTYTSKYPPGQGLALALGQVLGNPWIGVLISVAALIIAAGWAMRAWLPAPFGLLGATLVALRIGVMSYWTNSYWGGAAAGVGGALLIGALPRLIKRPTPLAGALLGVGLGILAISRPFEGFILSAVAFALWTMDAAWRIYRKRRPDPPARSPGASLRDFIPAFAAAAIAVVFILSWLAYYQAAVTGDPLVAPYSAWRKTYSRYEAFLWETPVRHYTPVNEGYARFVYWAQESHEQYASAFSRLARMGYQLVAFFWGPMLALFLTLAAPWLGRNPRVRLLALAVVLTVLAEAVLVDLWTFSHYLSPLTVALAILGTQAIRIVIAGARRRLGGPRPGFLYLLLGLPVILAGLNLGGLFLRNTDRLWTTPTYDTGWCCYGPPSERARVEEELTALDGRHLVFVRHPPEGYWGAEWVYNRASIDDAKIVWAREVSPEADCALRRYYRGRQVWLAYVHEQPAHATPFPDPGCDTAGAANSSP
jgi:hypothetical protein